MIPIFEVKDHGYVLVLIIGDVYSSDIACPFFVLCNCFLGITHLRVADPQIVFTSPSLPFDEVVHDCI